MKRAFLLLSVLTLSLLGFAQKIELEGTYQGKNMYIQNPASGAESYCTEKVLVNGKNVPFKHSSAYEIHLDTLELKIGDPIKIEIFHKPDCKPKVLSDHSTRKNTYELVSISVDSIAVLHFTTKGETGKLPFIIEQFRWNKWITVGEVDGKGEFQENDYSFQTIPHSGKNQFRVKQVDSSTSCRLSKTADYLSETEVKTMPCTLKNEIAFDTETDYEVYDQSGTLIRKGRSKTISFSDLEQGAYYLNYDNKMGEFIVKKDKKSGENIIGHFKK